MIKVAVSMYFMKIIDEVDISGLGFEKIPDIFSDVKVENYFDCTDNFLTSLEGAPKEVGGNFYCPYNPLTSLEGLPKEIGEDLYISFAKEIHFTEEEIRKVSKIKGKVYILDA